MTNEEWLKDDSPPHLSRWCVKCGSRFDIFPPPDDGGKLETKCLICRKDSL